MQFSRPEYWSGLPFPSPEDLPDTGIEPRSPTLQADSLPAEPPGKPICRWDGPILVQMPTLPEPGLCQLISYRSGVPRPRAMDSIGQWSVRKQVTQREVRDGQVTEASSAFTEAPHGSYHRLSSPSSQISGDIRFP